MQSYFILCDDDIIDYMDMLKNKSGFEPDDEKPKGKWQLGRRNFS